MVVFVLYHPCCQARKRVFMMFPILIVIGDFNRRLAVNIFPNIGYAKTAFVKSPFLAGLF